MVKAVINKIIDSSVVDGPGNRTAIFFQGCNFNCRYCHNPETINHCMHCFDCVPKCPAHALSVSDNKVIWNKAVCVNCDTCIKVCSHNASPKIEFLGLDEVVGRIKDNMPFITGITTSGGECTLQKEFLTPLFKQTRKLGITNFVDSNGSIRFSDYPELVENIDGVMLDIKAFNRDAHIELTSVDNEMVLENAEYLAGISKLYEIRTVILGEYPFNRDTVYEITHMLKKYQNINPIRYKLIRFRPFGVREEFKDLKVPDEDEMQTLKELAKMNGFTNVVMI